LEGKLEKLDPKLALDYYDLASKYELSQLERTLNYYASSYCQHAAKDDPWIPLLYVGAASSPSPDKKAVAIIRSRIFRIFKLFAQKYFHLLVATATGVEEAKTLIRFVGEQLNKCALVKCEFSWCQNCRNMLT